MTVDPIVLLKAAILGVVEGLTEFLPVSSTGHLIVVSRAVGWESPTFEIFIQVGAILALTWCYRESLWQLATGILRPGRERAFLGKVLLAFLPAAVVGLALHDWIEAHLFRAETVSASLIVGGFLLLILDRDDRQQRGQPVEDISVKQALGIGLGQVFSLFPGVSRSGATIIAGMLAGLDRRAATEFSFYLAIPTIYAASGYALLKARHELDSGSAASLLVGLVVAYGTALVVIRAFLQFVQGNSLRAFGWYRIFAGLGVVAWLLWLG